MMNLSSLSKAYVTACLSVLLCTIGTGLMLVHGQFLDAAGIGLSAVSASVTLWLFSRTRNVIHRAGIILTQVAEGKLDVRIVDIREKGELGLLERNINRMLDLTEVFTKEADAAMTMTAEGRYFRHVLTDGLAGEFAVHARKINLALESMDDRSGTFTAEAVRVGDMIKRESETMAATATELEATSRQMNEIAGHASTSSAEVVNVAENASAETESVAAAAGEVASGVREVASQVTQSAGKAQAAVNRVTSTEKDMQSLMEAAHRIGEVTKLINDIAGQTNLLALNATIEAARAGDAGKGFAVVANEVKNLANQTGKATEEIGSQIASMRSATEAAVLAIRDIAEMIRDLNESFTIITESTEQQSAAISEISRSIQGVSQGIGQVAQTIGDVAERSGTATEAAGQVLIAAGALAEQTVRMNDRIDSFVQRVTTGMHAKV